MGEPSPPFIRIRTPDIVPKVEPYDRALELAGHVHRAMETAGARFHLKDRLDRCVTGLAVELARAAAGIKPGRWRHYRAAHLLATDCATMLDLLSRQGARGDDLDQARQTAALLIEQLVPLTLG